MKNQTKNFESLLLTASENYDLRSFFDDFLTLIICSFSRGLPDHPYNRETYLEVQSKYSDSDDVFIELLAQLLLETEIRRTHPKGNDILGDFYQMKLLDDSFDPRFSPWSIQQLIAECNDILHPHLDQKGRMRIMDMACGSGRMLMANAQVNGRFHSYYGLDSELVFVKMTSINLFLNRMFNSEVMFVNESKPEVFQNSFRISIAPLGIFPVRDPEKSKIWNFYQPIIKRRAEGGKGNQ